MERTLLHDLRGSLNTVMMCLYLSPCDELPKRLKPLTDRLNDAQAGNLSDDEMRLAVLQAKNLSADAMTLVDL